MSTHVMSIGFILNPTPQGNNDNQNPSFKNRSSQQSTLPKMFANWKPGSKQMNEAEYSLCMDMSVVLSPYSIGKRQRALIQAEFSTAISSPGALAHFWPFQTYWHLWRVQSRFYWRDACSPFFRFPRHSGILWFYKIGRMTVGELPIWETRKQESKANSFYRVKILFVLLFGYVRRIWAAKLQQAAKMVAEKAKMVAEKAKQAAPVLAK